MAVWSIDLAAAWQLSASVQTARTGSDGDALGLVLTRTRGAREGEKREGNYVFHHSVTGKKISYHINVNSRKHGCK